MKIGLTGIPGTGKRKLAERVASECGEELVIVDDYVEGLAKKLGIEISHRSSYMANLLAATEREKELQYLRVNDVSFISCGTVADSVAISSTFVAKLAQFVEHNRDSVMHVQQLEKEISAFHTLVYMSLDILGMYDRIFYLPIPKSLELFVPGRDRLAPDLRAIDREIRQFLVSVNISHVILDGSFDDSVEEVLKCFSTSSPQSDSSLDSTISG